MISIFFNPTYSLRAPTRFSRGSCVVLRAMTDLSAVAVERDEHFSRSNGHLANLEMNYRQLSFAIRCL